MTTESGLKNETCQETATLVLAIANTTFKKSGEWVQYTKSMHQWMSRENMLGSPWGGHFWNNIWKNYFSNYISDKWITTNQSNCN